MSWLRNRILPLFTIGLLAFPLACASDEERAENARLDFERAVATDDFVAALSAIEDLEGALPDSPDSAIEVAEQFVRAGELNRALWRLEAGLEQHPDSHDLMIAVANVSLKVGDAAAALAALAQVPPDSDQYPLTAMMRARAQRDLGDVEASLATLKAAESEFPDWTEYRIMRVESLVAETRLPEALALVQEARSRDDLAESRRNWFALSEASLLAEAGQTDDALRILEEATEADPSDREAWQRRFDQMLEHRSLDELHTALSVALEARPDIGFLYSMLASVEGRRGNGAAAEAFARRGVEEVGDEAAVVSYANYLLQQGRAAEGAELLAESIAESGETTELESMRVAMLIAAGDLNEARSAFDEFKRRHWSDPRSEYLRARFELVEGDAVDAAERLSRVAPRFNRSDLHYWLGVALEMSGDYQGAEYRYGVAMSRDSQQIQAIVGLIRMLSRRGAWQQLGAAATEWLRVQPINEIALAVLNHSLMELGEFAEAERIQRENIARFPELLAPRLALAGALRAQKRAAESLVVLDACATEFGGRTEWLAARALTLRDLGRDEEALAVLDRPAAEGDPAPLHRARAVLLLSAGKTREGLAAAERAVELAPDDPSPLRLVGDFHSGRGDFSAAVAAYSRFLEIRPDRSEVQFRLGIAYDRSGNLPAAIASYRRAVDADPEAVAPRNNLALALERDGQLDEALAAAQRAYALASANPMVLDTLGWLYLRSNRPARALALLEKARAAAPDSPEVRYHVALAYQETGRIDDARSILTQLNASLAADHELFDRVEAAMAGIR